MKFRSNIFVNIEVIIVNFDKVFEKFCRRKFEYFGHNHMKIFECVEIIDMWKIFENIVII